MKDRSSLETGLSVIRAALRTLPETPGVYRMLSEDGKALYVGKAKALKRRVRSYTKIEELPVRLQRMVALTRSMEFVSTHTEVEALLLESNLIKTLKPRYNILLRDDKSFPYILITGHHDYPQIVKHRGAKKPEGSYYGPFAGAGDVNRTIGALQRAFMLRNCSDNVFAQRTRPCLQYHIKRCTAPCVDKVTVAEYGAQVSEAKAFLDGKSRAVQERLVKAMETASAAQDYERAAQLRDRIKALSAISARQDINIEGVKDADVFALAQEGGQSCMQVFFFRGGQNFGNRAYFPRHAEDEAPEAIFTAFLAQFYENKPVPGEILLSHLPEDVELLREALRSRRNSAVKITKPQHGKRKNLIDFSRLNAQASLLRRSAAQDDTQKLLAALAALFALEDVPKRIEVYDNSHISGTNMVGAMIVAGPEGFRKNAYRKFNIRHAGAADDIAMMREVLERRFKRLLIEHEKSKNNPLPEGRGDVEGNWPDILLIDGGLGQFNACRETLEEMGLADELCLVAIAKGQDRHAGRERFFLEGKAPFQLPVNDPVLHYLQRLRDEAHRFAVGSHRVRREKQMTSTPLDTLPGVGPARKKALLYHFGSAKAVAQAGIEDLAKVQGISRALAQKIYDYFH